MAGRNSESIPLEKLEAQLEEELARGGDNFEAFGLKLPGGQVTSFGIVVLLSAQLYLLLYLRQLGGNLTSVGMSLGWLWRVPGWGSPCMQSAWLLLRSQFTCCGMERYLLRLARVRVGWIGSAFFFPHC